MYAATYFLACRIIYPLARLAPEHGDSSVLSLPPIERAFIESQPLPKASFLRGLS